jgi:hypothetical protein
LPGDNHEHAHGEGQQFVGSVAHDDVLALAAVVFGQPVPQRVRRRIRVEAQPIVQGVAKGCQDFRGWPVGVLVGVELDQPFRLGLLTGDVGGELLD